MVLVIMHLFLLILPIILHLLIELLHIFLALPHQLIMTDLIFSALHFQGLALVIELPTPLLLMQAQLAAGYSAILPLILGVLPNLIYR